MVTMSGTVYLLLELVIDAAHTVKRRWDGILRWFTACPILFTGLKHSRLSEHRARLPDAPFHRGFGTYLSGVGDWREWLQGTCPIGHGPAGWRQRARLANSAASGWAAAKATRTRLEVSMMRAAILIRRIRKVVNSAVASDCGLGMASRTLSISQ